MLKTNQFGGLLQAKNLTKGKDRGTPHRLMKDEIIIPKDRAELSLSVPVIIKLSDEVRERRSKLTNTYVYQVDEYDSLSWQLTLMDFKVEHSEI